MKQYLILILIFLPAVAFSQTRGTVVDKNTGNPIEYANIWIENQNIGTTSDHDGKFILNRNIGDLTLIVSVIGYENRRFNINKDNLKLELIPKIYEIEEVIVLPKKNRELIVNDLRKASMLNTFSCAGVPWMVAKYFEYLPAYEQTPFLKKIRIITKSEIDSATFNLRILSVNEKGEPATDILKNNFIITVKKGKKKTLVDLSDYHISFPKEGFFVSFEWLIIDRNKSFKHSNGFIKYNPSFVFIVRNGSKKNWIYTSGAWKKEVIPFPDNKDKHQDLAVELTLSN